MSQVIVTQDRLKEARARSGIQEHAIDTASVHKAWHLPESKLAALLAKGVGVAALPVLAFWSLLTGLLVVMVGAIQAVFKVLGLVFRRKDG